jgi:hypothetical protein
VRIRYDWQAIGGGTLGATSTPWFIPGNTGNADKLEDGTLYGSVMAMALQGVDFVASSEFHVTMSFSSEVDWHFDTTTNAPFSKWDHATTSLHEIGHALFFTGVVGASPQRGTAGFTSGSNEPGRFDLFLAASSSAGVAASCASAPPNFYNAITNSGLRFTDPEVPGTDFALYSPFPFRPGSSVYHHSPDSIETDCENNGIARSECSVRLLLLAYPGISLSTPWQINPCLFGLITNCCALWSSRSCQLIRI